MCLPCSAQETTEAQKMEKWDRVSIKDGAELYGNEKRENDESLPPVKRWTFGRFLKRSAYGTEKLNLAKEGIWWVDRDAFWPVYRVIGTEPVEIVGIFAKPGHEKAKKYESDKLESRTVGWLQPGELVAVDALSQALLKTYVVQTEAGLFGYVDLESLVPVGDTRLQ
jgi:hypothetical protein